MARERIIETNEGIQDEFSIEQYDIMMRSLRNRGWIETNDIIKHGITKGTALEIGPGPGYLGLEWLKNTTGTRLTAAEISSNMIKMAEKNSRKYGLSERTEYVLCNADKMPFEDNMFDAVFTNGSLHEWEHPELIFNEIYRVTKPGGRFFISDLRRDSGFLVKAFLRMFTKPAAMRKGLKSSLDAAYTPSELKKIIEDTNLKGAVVKGNLFGLSISGIK